MIPTNISDIIPEEYKDRPFLNGVKRKNYRSKDNFPADHVLGTYVPYTPPPANILTYEEALSVFNKIIVSKLGNSIRTTPLQIDIVRNMIRWFVKSDNTINCNGSEIALNPLPSTKGLWIYGDYGSGKTTIATTLAQLINLAVHHRYDNVRKIKSIAYNHLYDNCRNHKDMSYLNDLRGSVYVDDVMYSGRFELKLFGNTERLPDLIIDRMYESYTKGEKQLIVTSNYTPQWMLENGYIHKGNYSRCCEMFNIIYWKGQDHRQK
jgi:hypothetical protein